MVDGFLVAKPIRQLAHPVLELDLRLEAEQLLRAGRVGVAVTDIARAVLPDPLRLDLYAETVRQSRRDVVHSRRTTRAEVDGMVQGTLGRERSDDPLDDVAH